MTEPDLTVAVPAADGVTPLHTEVFLPAGDVDAGRRRPALLHRTPYGTADQRAEARAHAERGFASVLQDLRGRFGSGGDFNDRDVDATDGAATVEWVAAQPWCDGRVATWGVSYPGYTQLATASARPAPLACLAPVMGPAWWRAVDFREGGAVLLAAAAHWIPRQAATSPDVPDDARAELLLRAFEFEQLLDDPDPLAHSQLVRAPAADLDLVAGSPMFERLWRDLWRTPPAPPWSGDPGPPRGTEPIAPTLLVGGWYDLFVRDTVEAFERLGGDPSAHRLVLAPAGHGFHPLAAFPLTFDEVVGPAGVFLDVGPRWAAEHLLADAGTELRSLPRVSWYVMNAGRWRGATAWPPPGATPLRLFLTGRRDLTKQPAAPQGGTTPTVSFVSDPRTPVPTRGGSGLGLPPGPHDQEGLTGGARLDVASFTSNPFTHGLELAGPVTATLLVTSTAPDYDVAAKLLDVAPDGSAVSVVDGIVRMRWRHAPAEDLPTPGEVERVVVHLGEIGWWLRPGHALRLDLAGSNFPKYDRNPQTGAPEGTDERDAFRSAVHTVCTGPDRASWLTVTVAPEEH